MGETIPAKGVYGEPRVDLVGVLNHGGDARVEVAGFAGEVHAGGAEGDEMLVERGIVGGSLHFALVAVVAFGFAFVGGSDLGLEGLVVGFEFGERVGFGSRGGGGGGRGRDRMGRKRRRRERFCDIGVFEFDGNGRVGNGVFFVVMSIGSSAFGSFLLDANSCFLTVSGG